MHFFSFGASIGKLETLFQIIIQCLSRRVANAGKYPHGLFPVGGFLKKEVVHVVAKVLLYELR